MRPGQLRPGDYYRREVSDVDFEASMRPGQLRPGDEFEIHNGNDYTDGLQ